MSSRRRLPPEYLVQSVKRKIRNGLIRKPAWLQSALLHPPPLTPLRKRSNIPKLTFPEDRLRARVVKAFPEMTRAAHRLLPGDASVYRHPVDQFVWRQVQLMKEKNMTEEESFETVSKEHAKSKLLQRIEKSVQEKQAKEKGVPRRNVKSEFTRWKAVYDTERNLVTQHQFQQQCQRLHDLVDQRMGTHNPIETKDLPHGIHYSFLSRYLDAYPHAKQAFSPSLAFQDPSLARTLGISPTYQNASKVSSTLSAWDAKPNEHEDTSYEESWMKQRAIMDAYEVHGDVQGPFVPTGSTKVVLEVQQASQKKGSKRKFARRVKKKK